MVDMMTAPSIATAFGRFGPDELRRQVVLGGHARPSQLIGGQYRTAPRCWRWKPSVALPSGLWPPAPSSDMDHEAIPLRTASTRLRSETTPRRLLLSPLWSEIASILASA